MEPPHFPINQQISSAMDIFSHCIITLILENLDINLIPTHPILLVFEPTQNFTIKHDESYIYPGFKFEQVAFVRRKHPERFCWANIFSEIGRVFYSGTFLHSPLFPRISGSIGPVYFVWIENQKLSIQDELDTIYRRMLHTDLKKMGNREFCLFDGHQNIYHFNRYHRQDKSLNPNPIPLHLIRSSLKYTELICSKENWTDCIVRIDKTADLVATTFNKCFWIFADWMDVIWGELEYDVTVRKMQMKYFFQKPQIDWLSVANESQSLDDFIAYAILAHTLQNITIPQEIGYNEKHFYFGSSSLRNIAGNHQTILVEMKSCSFISCYGIQHKLSYEVFTKPFDLYTWAGIFSVVVMFVAMCKLASWMAKDEVQDFKGAPKDYGRPEDIVIVSFSVLLEISLPEYIHRVIPAKVIPIFWFWILCCGAITSMYKDVFTAEVILPYRRNPSWSHIYDLEELGFKFLLPLSQVPLYEQWYSNPTPVDSLASVDFSSEILQAGKYDGNLTRLLGYKRVARALLKNDPTLSSISFAIKPTVPRIWQELHYKWPTDLYSNLSKCQEKYVYLDDTENIKEILPFINDNRDGIVFMKGADDKFLSTYVGFQVDGTHKKNFIYDQLKKWVTSGIYGWWKEWFKKTKPKKLFPHYANWTKPVVHELERRDFMSKFTSVCEIWAICCVISAFVFLTEIRRKLYFVMNNWIKRISLRRLS
ncbi:hypothetical protein Fcan01_16396 [Folsomia candida]|uniref:Uncharacterized protein n=1 Tax=Folsomia candida TaxID=158441 RepID=A0A226DVR1_FOLCA|nr:hypothetical protein Fcan01_16396 [Folsomia candida]